MRPSSDRPANRAVYRGGYVRTTSVDGSSGRVVVAFPGYGLQPAESDIERTRSRVRGSWHPEVGVWHL